MWGIITQRLKISTLSSINPLGPLGEIIGYVTSGDSLPVKCREAEHRWPIYESPHEVIDKIKPIEEIDILVAPF